MRPTRGVLTTSAFIIRTLNLKSILGEICLRGHNAINHPNRDTIPKPRAIDLQKLMDDLHRWKDVLWVTLDMFGPLTAGTNANVIADMAMGFAEILLSTTEDVAPREKCQRGRQG